MEEYTQVTLNEWMEWKEDIRRKLAETASNFVYIGYRLKQIRDSGMLDGCPDIFAFALKEYGLGKSSVSRFIAINEKFSEGGNSLELKEEYKAIGSSKLAEMLTLTDSECQLITERTTVKEIRELKQFGRQQVTEDVEEAIQYTPLQKCIIAFLGQQDKREAVNRVMELLVDAAAEKDIREAAELINPGEYATYKKGIIFLFLYDYSTGVKYKSLTEAEPVSLSWYEFLLEVAKIYESYYQPGGDTWVNFYGEPAKKEAPKKEPEKQPVPEPEKPEETQENRAVATSQQEGEKKEDDKSLKGNVDDKPTERIEEKKEDELETGEAEQEEPVEEESSTLEEEGRAKTIAAIQELVSGLDEVYSWTSQELPTEAERQKVRDNLNMLVCQLDQLEEEMKEEV